MQLVADRFAVHEDKRAFDLATGARVALITGSAGGVSEQLRWTEGCTASRAMRHRARATLVDFGLLGESRRFEAWREKAIPTRTTSYPSAIRIIEQPTVAALAEMFHASVGGRPHVASLWGPRGAGKQVIAGELARIARLQGFVPVAARLLGSRQAELWRGRSLFVIAETADETAWCAFLSAAMTEPQPHVLLLVGEDECRSVSGIAVRRMPIDALVAAVRPPVVGGPLEDTVRRAAERAQGLPGRFAALVTQLRATPWVVYAKRPLNGRA